MNINFEPVMFMWWVEISSFQNVIFFVIIFENY